MTATIEENTARTAVAVPAGVTGAWVTVIGGGGGGGGGWAWSSTNTGGGSGGGGGGGTLRTWVPVALLGTSYTVEVGAGGTGGISSSAETETPTGGTASSFTSGGVTLTAGGGSAGANSASSAGTTGGAGGTVSVSGVTATSASGSAGGDGGSSASRAGTSASAPLLGGAAGGGGGAGKTNGNTTDYGGNGGSTLWTAASASGGEPGGAGSAGVISYPGAAGGGGGGGGSRSSAASGVLEATKGGDGAVRGGGGGGSGATGSSSRSHGGAGGAGYTRIEWLDHLPVLHDATVTGSASASGGVVDTSWSHTCSGDDRVLLVFVTWSGGTGQPFTLTHDGVGVPHRASATGATGAVKSAVFILENPAAGAKTVGLQSGQNITSIKYVSMSYRNAKRVGAVWTASEWNSQPSPVTFTGTNMYSRLCVAHTQDQYSTLKPLTPCDPRHLDNSGLLHIAVDDIETTDTSTELKVRSDNLPTGILGVLLDSAGTDGLVTDTQRVTAAFTGAHTQAGGLAVGAQRVTAALSAAHTQAGVSAAALKKALFGGGGGQTQQGTVAAAARSALAAAAGVAPERFGTLTAGTRRATAAAAGGQTHTATAASVLRRATAAITARIPTTGTATAALRRATAAAAGGQTHTAEITARTAAAAASMTAGFGGITRVGGATALATTITLPEHQVGDLIVMYAYRTGVSWPAPSLPSGWIDLAAAGSAWNCDRVAYRIATATDTVSGTWTGATGLAVAIYRTVGRWRPPVVAGNGNTWASSTMVWPDLPARPGGQWFVRFAGNRLATNLDAAPPAGWTDVASSPTRIRVIDSGAGVVTSANNIGGNTQIADAATSWRTATVSITDAVALGGPADTVLAKIPESGSVATLSGLSFNLYNDMPDKFMGLFKQNQYSMTQIRYPASLANNSITEGVRMLNDWLRSTTGQKIVLAQSQGAQVATRWMDAYADDPTAPDPADLLFILSGNPCSSQRGFAAATGAAEVDGLIAQYTRTDTPWPVIDVHVRWDGWSDWPVDDTNQRAVRNAKLGQASRHKRYGGVDLYDPSNTVWTVGNTTHILTAADAFGVPYLDKQASPACVLTATIAEIEAAYDRPENDPDIPVAQPVNKFERGLMERAGLASYIAP